MSNIDSSLRTPFFPRRNGSTSSSSKAGQAAKIARNSYTKASDIQQRTGKDARVDIPDAVKDFSQIKRVADSAPDIDNSDKIARLKAQIQNGTYEVNYDALADKILESEF